MLDFLIIIAASSSVVIPIVCIKIFAEAVCWLGRVKRKP